MDFDIPKLVRKDTAPFVFRFPDGTVITLHTRPLTFDTREVFNDAFRDRGERPKTSDKFDERMLTRAQNLETLARCCVPSWEGVLRGGKPVDCTPEEVLKFLRFLDETAGYREEVTAYLHWAQTPQSFREPLVEVSKVGEG